MKKLTIQKTFCTYCRGKITNKKKQKLRIQTHIVCKSAVDNIEEEHGLKQIKDWLVQFYPENYKYSLDYFKTWNEISVGTSWKDRDHNLYESYTPDSVHMLKDSLTVLVFHNVKLTRRIPDTIGKLTNLKELGLSGLGIYYDYEILSNLVSANKVLFTYTTKR